MTINVLRYLSIINLLNTIIILSLLEFGRFYIVTLFIAVLLIDLFLIIKTIKGSKTTAVLLMLVNIFIIILFIQRIYWQIQTAHEEFIQGLKFELLFFIPFFFINVISLIDLIALLFKQKQAKS